jgi:hypothetical protein
MDQYHYSAERWLNDKSGEQGSVIDGRCDNLFDGWRLAMSSFDKMLGWFPHTATEWIESHHSGCAAVAADGDGHIGA